ncbi:hypothetical protein FBU30_005895 [Linnemannia zychae]|nr:hypothetical protein FBU30_005895 [Linnemannia zychae]
MQSNPLSGSSPANRQSVNSHPARPPPQQQPNSTTQQQQQQQEQPRQQHQQQPRQQQQTSSSSAAASSSTSGKKRPKRPKPEKPEGGVKKPQISSCDNCKEGHRKCNGLEPCMNCEDSSIPCRYDSLSVAKKKAHDAYVLMKKQERTQVLKNAEIIVARMGQLDIAGSNNNFGPILSQVINLPRYEQPSIDFQTDNQRIQSIGHAEKKLIDCYFNHFNYYIPVLSRKTFMEQVQDPAQLLTMEVQKLLTCVLATGFAFRHEMGDQDVIKKMEPNFGTGMARRFHHFNVQDVFNSSIVNCQCYLILTGFYSSVANYDAVHNLVALSHSAAAGLGLNRVKGYYYQYKDGPNGHTTESIELGHRIFWCIVIVCSGYSLSHQSPFITSNDYDIPFPARQLSDQCLDFHGNMQDDYEGIKDLEHFVPMYEICSRVADITCTATRQRPHTKVNEVREMMHEWRAKTLPTYLRITPTDMDAIVSQSRFSKFYHAVAYMFEICLHHTFQLHESHRELGVHGIWSSYCYDAAIGIKNIYNTRPMTRMNAHVILPVAAGAFANIVASKILGKDESAQRYCDEIKVMLQDIIRASSSMERPQLIGSVTHSFNGVTKLTTDKVEEFTVNAPTSPPRNERSPGHTESSQSPSQSPSQSTDISGYTDAESSCDEDGDGQLQSDYEGQMSDPDDMETQNLRMADHFSHDITYQASANKGRQQQQHYQSESQQQFQQQQQQEQQQHRSHLGISLRSESNPSLYSNTRLPPQQQHYHHQSPHDVGVEHSQHSLIDGKYMTAGYNNSTPLNQTSAPISEPSIAHRPHLPSRSTGSSSSTFQSDGGKTTADSGYIDSSYAVTGPDQGSYFVSLSEHNSRDRHHQLINDHQQQSLNSNLAFRTTSMMGLPNTMNMDGHDSRELMAFYNQLGIEDGELNDAQLSKLEEYRLLLSNGNLSEQEMQNLEIELNKQLITLGSIMPLSPPHGDSLASYGGQDMYSQAQQTQAQSQSISVSTTLQESKLLSGGFEGFGMIPGYPASIGDINLMAESFIQDGQHPTYPPLLTTSSASGTTRSFSDTSDLVSPLSAGSNQQHQLLSGYAQVDQDFTTKQPGVVAPMGAVAFAGGNNFGGQEMLMYSTLAAGSGAGVEGPTVLAVGHGYGTLDAGQTSMLFGSSGLGGSNTNALLSNRAANSCDESLMHLMNDPDILLKGQIFSQVTSNSLQQQQQQPHQQQQPQGSHRYPLSYHQSSH